MNPIQYPASPGNPNAGCETENLRAIIIHGDGVEDSTVRPARPAVLQTRPTPPKPPKPPKSDDSGDPIAGA
jgi:hypothetical protein